MTLLITALAREGGGNFCSLVIVVKVSGSGFTVSGLGSRV